MLVGPELCAERASGVGVDSEHRPHRVGDDLSKFQTAGAEQERITESLSPLFSDRTVSFVRLVTRRPLRDELERARRYPMLIDALGERSRIGAAIKRGEVMRETSILQIALVAGDKHPIIRMTEQPAAFGGENSSSLVIRHLCQVGPEVFGAA